MSKLWYHLEAVYGNRFVLHHKPGFFTDFCKNNPKNVRGKSRVPRLWHNFLLYYYTQAKNIL